MTDYAIKKQLDALEQTTKEALKSKKASLQLLTQLRLIPTTKPAKSQSLKKQLS